MAVVGKEVLGRERRLSAKNPEEVSCAAGAHRSLLSTLLGRCLWKLGGWVAPVGRFNLYAGLLLVAFTAFRLPAEIGAVADIFLFVGMVCAVLSFLQGRTLKSGLLRTHAIGLALLISGVWIATLAGSSDEWQSLLSSGKFLFATTATIVACMILLKSRSQVTTALGCWVASAALTSIAAVLQAALGDSLIGEEIHWGRMTGLSGHPNHLGAVAGMAIGGALCLAAMSDRLVRALWLIAAALCIFGVIASASRSGAVVALASVGLWAVMYYRLNRAFTTLVLGGCMAMTAVAGILFVEFWSGANLTDRLARATDPYADGAVANRLYQYEDALQDALRSPLVGVGLADRDAKIHGIGVHNTFLMLFRAGGLLALFGIVLILADLVHKGIVLYWQAGSSRSKALAIGSIAGIIGLILDAMVEPVLYQRMYWIPSALLLASLSLQQRPHVYRKMSGTNRSKHRSDHKRVLAHGRSLR